MTEFFRELILPWILLSLPYFAGAFAASIFVLVALRRYGVFDRSKARWKAWPWVARLQYPFLCAVITLFGGLLGTVHNAEVAVCAVIDREAAPLAREYVPTLKEYLSRLPASQGQDAVQAFLRKFYLAERPQAGWLERKLTGAANYFSLNAGKWVLTTGAAAVATYAVGRAGDGAGLDGDTVKLALEVVRDMDLSKVDSTFAQVLSQAFQKQVGRLASALRLKLAIVALLAFLLSAGEVALYRRHLKAGGPLITEPR